MPILFMLLHMPAPICVMILVTIAVYQLICGRMAGDKVSAGIVGVFMGYVLWVAYIQRTPFIEWSIGIGLVLGLALWIMGIYAEWNKPGRA